MSANGNKPEDVTLAVIGSGFGALLVYTTAVYLGFRPEQIGIFGENLNPVATYQQFAWNLGQTVLRSESESHFLPADWPTFAQLDAYARRDPAPLFRSAGRKFNPGVPEIMAEAKTVGDDARLRRSGSSGGTKVGWIVREPGPPAALLALRRGREPARPRQARDDRHRARAARLPGRSTARRARTPQMRDRIVQAYEPKQLPRGRALRRASGRASRR